MNLKKIEEMKKDSDKLEEAKELLKEFEERNMKKCMKEIEDVLNKYNYSLNISNIISLIPKRK
ncbi:MAG TPA: hypothetical protein ENG87_05925 [Candidatus Pacearchaeota archaeon]|nr:hypothetical protein [Candidatus Pacearchaeota archaeon]